MCAGPEKRLPTNRKKAKSEMSQRQCLEVLLIIGTISLHLEAWLARLRKRSIPAETKIAIKSNRRQKVFEFITKLPARPSAHCKIHRSCWCSMHCGWAGCMCCSDRSGTCRPRPPARPSPLSRSRSNYSYSSRLVCISNIRPASSFCLATLVFADLVMCLMMFRHRNSADCSTSLGTPFSVDSVD